MLDSMRCCLRRVRFYNLKIKVLSLKLHAMLLCLKPWLAPAITAIQRITAFITVRLVIGIISCLFIYFSYYAYFYTPLPVYILDKLNLRPLFLPNIICHGCNNFSYPIIIDNAKVCSGKKDVFLLIMVASSHAHANARHVIRRTWGNVTEYRGKRIQTIFLFGVHEDHNLNSQLHYEQKTYGDIVHANFTDSYRSLTNKSMFGLEWVTKFCPDAKYVLKTDDDSFNVPQRFVDYLVTVKTPEFVGGYCFTVIPDRRTSSKFYTTIDMYPDTYYPTYCSGPAYILSKAAVKAIHQVAPNALFLPMEDVFVSGVARVAAGIQYIQIPGIVEGQQTMTPCNLATWVKNGHNIVPGRAEQLWKKVVDSDAEEDCAGRHTAIFIFCLLFLIVWAKHLYRLTVGWPQNLVCRVSL